MTDKRQYRRGRGRASETPQPVVAVGDVDRMSVLAAKYGVTRCDADGRCSRVQGHDEIGDTKHKGFNPLHPSRQHVQTSLQGVAIVVWWDDTSQEESA